jgi:hypothetical protein
MRGLCLSIGGYLLCSLLRNSGINPGPAHVEFVVNKLVLEQVFLRVLLFSPVSTLQWCSMLFHLSLSDAVYSGLLKVSLNNELKNIRDYVF